MQVRRRQVWQPLLLILFVSGLACSGRVLSTPQRSFNETDEYKADIMTKIYEVNKQLGGYHKMIAALTQTGSDKRLASKGAFTVFLFSDEAITRLPVEGQEALFKDATAVKTLVGRHLIDGKVLAVNKRRVSSIVRRFPTLFEFKAADISEMKSQKTVSGQPMTVTLNKDAVLVNGAKLTRKDILCRNGVIHVVDAVSLP